MPKSFAIVAFTFTASLSAACAEAATSMPMPEAGFALASNSGGGVDTIATPMSSDLGGGAAHAPSRTHSGSEAAVETPGSEPSAPDTTGTANVREEHPHKTGANDGAPNGTAASSAHKSRANAHWQSLLPGLMK